MWIFTKHGFFSAVEHATKRDLLVVRARCSADMQALQKGLLASTGRRYMAERTDRADYRYRVLVSKGDFSSLVARWALTINYPNFKDAVHGDPVRDAAYLECWQAMSLFQERETMMDSLRQPEPNKRKRNGRRTA